MISEESPFCEVFVKISSEDGSQKYTYKTLCYERISISKESSVLLNIVEEAKSQFKGSADEISITIRYEW